MFAWNWKQTKIKWEFIIVWKRESWNHKILISHALTTQKATDQDLEKYKKEKYTLVFKI